MHHFEKLSKEHILLKYLVLSQLVGGFFSLRTREDLSVRFSDGVCEFLSLFSGSKWRGPFIQVFSSQKSPGSGGPYHAHYTWCNFLGLSCCVTVRCWFCNLQFKRCLEEHFMAQEEAVQGRLWCKYLLRSSNDEELLIQVSLPMFLIDI